MSLRFQWGPAGASKGFLEEEPAGDGKGNDWVRVPSTHPPILPSTHPPWYTESARSCAELGRHRAECPVPGPVPGALGWRWRVLGLLEQRVRRLE